MDRLAAPVRRGTPALDPTVVLKAIKEAREGRALNAHPFGDFLLGQVISPLGEVNKRPPLALAQAQGTQPLVELGPPGARGPEKHESKLVNVWRRHVRTKLVSVLTNRLFPAIVKPFKSGPREVLRFARGSNSRPRRPSPPARLGWRC